MKIKEKWKLVIGFEGSYEVSNLGRIKSLQRWTVGEHIVPIRLWRGYCMVQLWKNNKNYVRRVHRLVALSFIPNLENKPQVNHKDGNKLNNTLPNLEWMTSSENHQHAYDNKIRVIPKGEENPQSRLTEKKVHKIKQLISKKMAYRLIAIKFKISKSYVSAINNGRSWDWVS